MVAAGQREKFVSILTTERLRLHLNRKFALRPIMRADRRSSSRGVVSGESFRLVSSIRATD
jgi:hypothetical protein